MIKQWSRFPFDPAKWPFFYGYFIIFAGSIGVIMSAPGQTIGVAVFRNYLEFDLQLSKTEFGTAYTIGTLISGLLAVYAGRLYDRYGARVIAPVASFFMGLSLLYLSFTPKIFAWLQIMNDTFYAMVLKVTLLVIGFFTLRFFGQGILTLVSRNMVMKWFDKRRGMANIYLGLFLVLGLNSSPQIFQSIIDSFTWQRAWQLLAIFVIIGFGSFALFFFRDNPKDSGLEPDGFKSVDIDNQGKTDAVVKKEYTLPEALRTYTFWIFNLVLAMHALFATGSAMYIKDIFIQAGYDEVKAVTVFIPSAIVAVVFQSIGSWLSDRTKLKYFLMILAMGLILTMVSILLLGRYAIMYELLILGMGMAMGNFGIVSTVSWPRFFGTKHLGAISGYNMKWVIVSSAIAPLYFSLFYDLKGNFNIPIIICMVITFALTLAAVKANNINR